MIIISMLLVCSLIGVVLGAVFSTEDFAEGAGGAQDVEAVLQQRRERSAVAAEREKDLEESGRRLPINGADLTPADREVDADSEQDADEEAGSGQTGRRLLSVPVSLSLGGGSGLLAALVVMTFIGEPTTVSWFFVIPAATVASAMALSSASFVVADRERRRLLELEAELTAEQEGRGASAWSSSEQRKSGYSGLEGWSR